MYGPEAEPLPVLRLQDLPLLRVRLVRLPAHINPLETHIVPPFQLSPPLQEAAPPGPNVPQVSYQDSSSSDSVPHPQDVPTQERNTQQVPHEETSSAEDSSLEEQDLPPEPFNFSDVETLHYPDVAPGPSQESIVQGIADLSARDDSFSGQEAPPAPPDPSDSSDSSLEYPTSESEDDDITQNDIAEAIADQGAPADYGSSEQSSEEDEQVPPQEMTLERHIGHIHVPPVAANTHMAAVRLRNPPAYTLGQYGRVRCPHCGAYKFDVERGRESMSADCCTKGQVSLPMPRIPPAFADTIHNAGWPRFAHFRRNDRIYNNSLAFASTHAEFPHFVGGPHFLTVQGQFYKAAFGGPVPAGDNAPRYNQLYYVETGEANQIRRNRYHDGDGEPLRAGIFDFMTNVLQEVNPFAQGYVSMRERVETERLAARQQGRAEPSEVRLLFRVRGATRQDRPTSYGEIAVVNVGEPQATVTYFCSSRQGGDELRRMRYDEGLSDAMLFPVMFPYGEPGFRQHIPLEFQRGRARHVTPNMFYRYMSAQRDGSDNIHCSNQLLQLYILHGFIKSQAELFYFLRQRTTMGRRDTLEELEGYVRGERGDRVGSAVKLLPSTVVGSPRWYQARLAEAKAITARAGLPTYLLTVTCNPEWKELQENKGPSQKVEDRPDLVAHVFNLFLRQIEYEVRTLQVLGVCVAYLRVTEYQKRGLPHAHALITVRPEDVPRTAAHVDTVISAELPDPELEPELHQVLTRCNFHDRCELNEDAPCLNPGTRTCSKGYPKPYRETTDLYHESGRVEYRRRDDGREYVNAQGVAFRNRNLVPFNAYMSRRFGTHINIEFLNKFEGMFYMYDYIYKGQDHTRYGVGDRPDAINDYVNSRYTGSCEAAARLKGYKLCVSFPQVCRLAVHLERQQQLVHRKGQEAEVVAHPRRTRTSLVAAMELNVRNNVARQVQYEFLLDRFVYNDTTRNFTERATRHPVPLFVVIGRPCRELYALERLLKHMAGPTSYGHLRGRHDSLWARGCALDLFHNETMFGEVTMHALANDETATGQMRRDAFAMLSATYAFEDADAVLRRYSGPLCEGLEKDNFTQMLASCNGIIKTLGGQLVDLDLAIEERAELVREMYNDERYAPSPDAERQAAFREVTRRAQHDLNQEQKDALRAILHAVDDYAEQKRYDQAKCFFVEGPAGCGKTYLYECIILYLKSHGYHHVVCSTSGISAALLPSGETCHKAFGLPTNLHYGSTSQIKVQTDEAEIVRGANIIIADEMGAASKHMLDAMDVLLRDLHNSDVPFGAVPIVCGGDFRQTLPVYQRAHTAACIENGIMRSELWPLFQVHRLTTNMRAAAATFQFRDLLLNVGNGTLPYLTNDSLRVNLPNNIICQGDLISAIFGNPVDLQACADRAILCPKRDHVKVTLTTWCLCHNFSNHALWITVDQRRGHGKVARTTACATLRVLHIL